MQSKGFFSLDNSKIHDIFNLKYIAVLLTATLIVTLTFTKVNIPFHDKFSLVILFNTSQAGAKLLSPALHCLTCKGIQEIPRAKQKLFSII